MSSCSKKPDEPAPPDPLRRCEVDLSKTGYFATEGTGSSAKLVEGAADLIGGEGATGRTGDVLLQNDKIRLIIQQAGRSVGPIPSGGHLIDADLQRGAGEAGQDAFGRMNLIYGLGRLSSVHQVDIISDGARGGPAIVASTGHDAPHDLLNLRSLLKAEAGLSVEFVVDQFKPQPLRTTTYYVLSPGEERVRMLTAFCNDGTSGQSQPLIELLDVGAFELFFPGGCSNGLGAKLDLNGCAVQSTAYWTAQGRNIAYGYRPMSLADPAQPSVKNASIGYGGVVGTFIEGEDLQGVLSWADPEARSRPGAFVVRPGSVRLQLADIVVGRDVAAVTSAMNRFGGVSTGTVEVSSEPNVRVAAIDAAGVMQSLIVTGADGKGRVNLPAGTWRFNAATQGRLVGPNAEVTLAVGETKSVQVQLAPTRKLHVVIKDEAGMPSPGKVTVHCANGPCTFNQDTWKQHELIDSPSGGAAAVDYVGPTGVLDVFVPPGQYDVIVSRGPEFSTWPDTWPNAGHRVDLTTQDGAVDARVGRVVDSTGWMSADLHVHAVASPDSAVPNLQRAANFLAEGVDVLLSTDHEYITDLAPAVRALGAENLMATMIGEEVTSFTHGHFNTFPLVIRPGTSNGGAFDHAGGEENPTLRVPQLFSGIKAEHPGAVVQLNHPRGGSGGVLTALRVDTATLRTHGDPADYLMAPDPTATATDTKLFGEGFDLVETANGPTASWAVMNDWMTFLSRGTVTTSSGVSDTHDAQSATGGYARTYTFMNGDTPAQFTSAKFADAIRSNQAFASNGPFLRFTAKKVSGGDSVGIGGTLSVASGEAIELTVDVTGLEWMQIDRVEIYSHAAGREAFDGESNGAWPEGRILQKHDITNPTIEAVPGSMALRRVPLTEKFMVSATADTWFVAMARGTTGRTLWPLHGGRAQAWTNAILVDADGSGRYDDFPLKAGQMLRAPKPKVAKPTVVPTVEQGEAAIRKLLSHKHE
ncbi:MAG: CehA/McbA family metallohydrolase [Myxococcaceae bacterium]|nr:CehA/McbA family metallohydrolase [Myxococcaceae bacterium]